MSKYGITVSDDEFRSVVSRHQTIASILRELNMKVVVVNYRAIHSKVAELGLDTHHWTGKAHGKTIPPRTPHAEIFKKNSKSSAKNRIIKDNLLPYVCAVCGISEWRGKPLTLQLDHINGVYNDNRLVNLRLICPNCHSQTDTFCGKNTRTKRSRKQNACVDCSTPITLRAKRCLRCAAQAKKSYKIEWPPLLVVQKMVQTLGYRGTGHELGVSDAAVKVSCKGSLQTQQGPSTFWANGPCVA